MADVSVEEAPARARRRLASGGVAGNERLTASTGVVLLALAAAEGVTILFLRPLLPVHFFVGMLLVPPVALKLASTGWRFVRYYSRSRPYVVKGPPHAALRLLAPLVVASTLALLASGIALALLGPPSRLVLTLHKASFVVWLVVTGIHVLAYVLRLPRLVASDWRRRASTPGAGARRALVLGSLAVGVALGAVVLPLAHPWTHRLFGG